MLTTHTTRDGSISVSWRDMARHGYVVPLDLFRALAESGAPSWAHDPSTCDLDHDEDGVRVSPLVLA